MMRLECGYAPTTSLKADMASGNVQSRAGRLAQHTRMVILRIVDGFYPLGWAKWSDEYVRPDSSVCSCGAPPPPGFHTQTARAFVRANVHAHLPPPAFGLTARLPRLRAGGRPPPRRFDRWRLRRGGGEAWSSQSPHRHSITHFNIPQTTPEYSVNNLDVYHRPLNVSSNCLVILWRSTDFPICLKQKATEKSVIKFHQSFI